MDIQCYKLKNSYDGVEAIIDENMLILNCRGEKILVNGSFINKSGILKQYMNAMKKENKKQNDGYFINCDKYTMNYLIDLLLTDSHNQGHNYEVINYLIKTLEIDIKK